MPTFFEDGRILAGATGGGQSRPTINNQYIPALGNEVVSCARPVGPQKIIYNLGNRTEILDLSTGVRTKVLDPRTNEEFESNFIEAHESGHWGVLGGVYRDSFGTNDTSLRPLAVSEAGILTIGYHHGGKLSLITAKGITPILNPAILIDRADADLDGTTWCARASAETVYWSERPGTSIKVPRSADLALAGPYMITWGHQQNALIAVDLRNGKYILVESVEATAFWPCARIHSDGHLWVGFSRRAGEAAGEIIIRKINPAAMEWLELAPAPIYKDPDPPASIPTFAVPHHAVQLRIFLEPGYVDDIFPARDGMPEMVFTDLNSGEAKVRERQEIARQRSAVLAVYHDTATHATVPSYINVPFVALQQCYPHREPPAITGRLRTLNEQKAIVTKSLENLVRLYGDRTGVTLAMYRQIYGDLIQYNWPLAHVLETLSHWWNEVIRLKIKHVTIFVQSRAIVEGKPRDGIAARIEFIESLQRIRAAIAAYQPAPPTKPEEPKPIPPIPVPPVTPEPPTMPQYDYAPIPTYASFIGPETDQIVIALQASRPPSTKKNPWWQFWKPRTVTTPYQPTASDLYHNFWRRLVEQRSLFDVVESIYNPESYIPWPIPSQILPGLDYTQSVLHESHEIANAFHQVRAGAPMDFAHTAYRRFVEGWSQYAIVADILGLPPVDPNPPPVIPQPPTKPARKGNVVASARAFVDGDGPFNAYSTSLFWSIWGEINDPDRLDANYKWAAEKHVDYIRILGMVGTETWADRKIDPKSPQYWETLDKVFARAEKYGLRIQPTIFADAQVMMPDKAERRAFAAQFAEFLKSRLQLVQFVEIANEPWQNGFSSDAELRELAEIIRGILPTTPIALGAPPDNAVCAWLQNYQGIATLHYDRDISKEDRAIRPIRQPWGYPNEYREREHYDGPMPGLAVNNEPIGPHSSVAEEIRADRIALAFVTTFIAGNAGYCYHTGAGIRGGGSADKARGRFANLYDYDLTIWDSLSHWRQLLPNGIANWTRHNAQWETMPWNGSQTAVDNKSLVRAYAATAGNQLVAVLLGVNKAHTVTARVGMEFDVLHPTTGAVVQHTKVSAGQSFSFPGPVLDNSGYVIVGKLL